MVSVALSLGLLPVDVIHRLALWSSDFPRLPHPLEGAGSAAASVPGRLTTPFYHLAGCRAPFLLTLAQQERHLVLSERSERSSSSAS